MPPDTVLLNVMLWALPVENVDVPTLVIGAEMMSAIVPEDIAVVVTVALTNRIIEPPSVKVPVRETEPLFVNESESTLTVPRLFDVVVRVVPPNTSENVPDVLTAVDQFAVVAQFVFVVPRHELSVPASTVLQAIAAKAREAHILEKVWLKGLFLAEGFIRRSCF